MASSNRGERTINPDTGEPESKLREQVREALDLSWDVRDAGILAEIRRLKVMEERLKTMEGRVARVIERIDCMLEA